MAIRMMGLAVAIRLGGLMGTNGGSGAASEAHGTLRAMQQGVSCGVQEVRGYVEKVDSKLRVFARERPLTAIACALGVGFLIGRLAARV